MAARSAAEAHVIRYLRQMSEIRGAATPETSYYPALCGLLDAVGGELKPAVKTVQQLRDTGFGVPDFGFAG